MPAFNEPGLRLEPVTRVDQVLDVLEVSVPGWDDVSELLCRGLKAVRQGLRRLAEVGFQLFLGFGIEILRGTRADDQEETRPGQVQRLLGSALDPPCAVLFEEGGRINDVVVEVDVVFECSDEQIWSSQHDCEGRRCTLLTHVWPRWQDF